MISSADRNARILSKIRDGAESKVSNDHGYSSRENLIMMCLETPGEDPYHSASYVHALINGLQGGLNPRYKGIVATCKHFAAYDMENW